MLKKISIAVGAIVAIFLIYVAVQPSDYAIERSITIDAPADVVFEFLNNVHKANDWNPWLELDPKAKVDYDGPPRGVGAISRWKGNSDIGAGRATITDSRVNEYVQVKLEFFEPMEGTGTAEYFIKIEDNKQTTVTWKMSGKNNFFSRMICVFIDMDKMMGEQFEKGLAKLKSITEGIAKAQPAKK